MIIGRSAANLRGLMGWVAALSAAMIASSAQARPFHLWSIQEVYSNSSGTLQFIELTDSPPADTFGGQNFVNGQVISVSNVGSTQTNSFTIPGSSLPGNTLDHMLLFGTAGIQAAGGPAPDYIIPDNFLFAGGGTVNFFGTNPGTYGPLPTDGTLALNWMTGGPMPNSETNFSGQSGVVGVPEPTTMALTPFAIGLAGVYRWLTRRRRAAQPGPSASANP